ncbi:MAG TPA: insulinase family protein [Terriglobales bacterium]|nr:insulinase family protein [Terriglobales bacterium]
MKYPRRFLRVLCVWFGLVSFSCAQMQHPAPPASAAAGQQGVDIGGRRIPIPPLPAFHPQQPKRIELSNGVIIFLQEDHELPLIDGQVRIRGGGRNLPASKTGMISIYGQAWRTGGTEAKTGDQLDDVLEARAAKVETNGATDSTFLSWSCLKGDFDEVFAIAADVLQHPAFRQDKIDLAKHQINGAIARRNDDVAGIAAREAGKLAFGPENPYARSAEYATVASVTRDDLLDWHRRTVVGANLMIGVVGDFDAAQMEAALRRVFEPLPRGERMADPDLHFAPAKPGVYFAPKEDVNQANIRMVMLSKLQRNDPDYFPVQVMEQAFLSGGFSARLTNYVRTVRGLAYDASGGFSVPYDRPGMFEVAAGTKSQSAVETVQAIYTALDDIQKHPITAEEMRRAKDSILNSFIFAVDSKDKLLTEQVTYAFYGYPSDFLERIRAGIEKVTINEVTRVAQKYIQPQELAVLVVGNDKEFEKPLSTLGPVSTLDISIPPPPGAQSSQPAGEEGAAAKPSAADQAQAHALVQKMVDNMGGAAKVNAVKAVTMKATLPIKGPEGDVTANINETVAYPDRARQDVETPMGNMVMVVTPQAGFVTAPQVGTQDMPASMKSDMADEIKRDLLFIAQHASDGGVTITPAGTEKVGTTNAQALKVNSEGAALTLYVDPNSGRVLRSRYTANGPSGPMEVVADFSDWRNVDGVMFPFKEHRNQGGEESDVQITDIKINPPIDPKTFQKPASSPQ